MQGISTSRTHFGKLAAFALIGILLGACSTKSHKVMPLRQEDKQLSCVDIELEINEAKYYVRQAEENKGVNVRNLLGPWTYIGTYMSAADAIDAAEQRITYLNQIHEIRRCDQEGYAQAISPPPAGVQAPQPGMQQPAAYYPQQAYAAPVMPVQQMPMMAMPPQYQYAPMAAPMQAPAYPQQQGYAYPAR